jgi:hypothetical protein
VVNGKFNFQLGNVPVPATYTKDTGLAYSDTRGYGWVRQDSLASATHTPLDLTKNTRDRDLSDTDGYEQRLDTLIFMQYPQSGANTTAVRTPGAWELALPCGTYNVDLSVGDSAYSSSSSDPGNFSTHRINVEGQSVIAGFTPSSSVKFASASRAVYVCDGRLTIDATGGSNTKLNYLDVTRVDSKINFQLDNVPVPALYTKDAGLPYSDTRGYGWVRQDSLSSADHLPLDLTKNTRDRDLPDTDQYDQRFDTLVFMQYPQSGLNTTAVRTPGAFEMAVPCGQYYVSVTVGDSAYSSSQTDPGYFSTHRINIEGQNAIAGFNPTNSTKFQTATRTVSVCDGRLTIDALGGSNTKLNYVDVVPTG